MVNRGLLLTLVSVSFAAHCGAQDKEGQEALVALRQAANDRQRIVLYQLDHLAAAKKLREFAQQIGWQPANIEASDLPFPAELRRFDPWGVWAYPDYIELEFGGTFGDVGFRAFRPGLAGYGTKKLATAYGATHKTGGFQHDEPSVALALSTSDRTILPSVSLFSYVVAMRHFARDISSFFR